MAIVDLKKLGLFTSVRKKLNRSLVVIPDHPNLGVGFKPILECGVYRMYPLAGEKICIREPFYEPFDQTQPNKIISQLKFAAAVLAWQSLTGPKKARYNQLAVGRYFSGYNLFIRDFMHG